MIGPTAQQYLDWPELVLPVKHSRLDLSITEIEGFCEVCGKLTTDYRGVIREFHSCLEIEFAGACHPCKTVTFANKFRWYPWGVLALKKGQWIWHKHEESNIFKRLWAAVTR